MTINRHVGLILLAAMSQAFASGDPHAAPAPAHAPAPAPAHAAPAAAHAPAKPVPAPAAPAAHAPVAEKKPEELAPSIRPLSTAIHPPRKAIHPVSPYAKPAVHKKASKSSHAAKAHVAADESSRALDAAVMMLGKLGGKHGEAAGAILSCDDSNKNRLLERGKRAYYVVQNPGNQLASGDAALTYAVRQLNVPVLLITARPGCKAVDMARSDYSRAPAELQKQLSTLFVDKDVSNNEAQLQNLDNQVEAAMLSFGGEVESGRLAIVGAYYDVSGTLGQGKGRLVVANLNGEKERKEISRLLARHNLSNAATGMTAPLLLDTHAEGKPAAASH